MTAPQRQFRYQAISPAGVGVSDVIAAADRQAALRQLSRAELVVTRLVETDAGRPVQRAGNSARQRRERLDMFRQLSVLIGAHIELLEALEAIHKTFPVGETRDALAAIAAALRRGDRLGDAFGAALPGLPAYLVALLAAGESTGCVDQVLREAVAQMLLEAAARRELRRALAYPAFLLTAGSLALAVMFAVVVPRFAAIIGPQRRDIDGLGGFVFAAGRIVHDHGVMIVIGLAVAGAMLVGVSKLTNAGSVAAIIGRLFGLRGIIELRERANWARIMALALGQNVLLLDAAALARSCVTTGALQARLVDAERALRSGVAVADALATNNILAAADISLLSAGQRAGALAEMFGVIADEHDRRLREALRRATAIAEQLAILVVSTAIGTIVLGLVSAMTSVYESVR